MSYLALAIRNFITIILQVLNTTVVIVGVLLWDNALFVLNLVLPNRAPDAVVPPGQPGANGAWPPYVPPKEGDSRCSCPALNTLANHGTLFWILIRAITPD